MLSENFGGIVYVCYVWLLCVFCRCRFLVSLEIGDEKVVSLGFWFLDFIIVDYWIGKFFGNIVNYVKLCVILISFIIVWKGVKFKLLSYFLIYVV